MKLCYGSAHAGSSWASIFLAMAILLTVTKLSSKTCTAFSATPRQIKKSPEMRSSVQDTCLGVSSTPPPKICRKEFLKTIYMAVGGVMTSTLLTNTVAAHAAESEMEELPSKESVSASFDSIRYELSDPNGGVAYMQGRIDQQDWAGLMEFTKTYDLELRKKRIGSAKKLLQSKDLKAQATEYANAVTFDLIGINRSSRKGQESVESANRYLQELREDVGKFLALEETIQVKT
jgi:hypothetical protein